MAKKSKNYEHDQRALWLVFGAMIFGLVTGYMIAYQKYSPEATFYKNSYMELKGQLDTLKGNLDKVMMKDGNMMVVKDGVESEMTADMTLDDGTKVMTDGTVVKSDGTKVMLKDGEWVKMNGMMGY